jgi:hypothetical protein
MAEIPVTKKSGMPWWVWLLLTLAVLALIYFLFLAGDDEEVAVVDRDVEVVETTSLITDLTTIEQGTVATLAGRRVDIDNVTVDAMYGDRGFTVTDQMGATVFVVIDEVVPGPDSGDDGDLDVNDGNVVSFTGEVRAVTDGRVNNEPIEGLPAGTELYVYADDVNKERM